MKLETLSSVGIEIRAGATGNTKTLCPECKHKSKSLSVHVEKKIWKCHHCGWSGGLNGSRPGEFHYSYPGGLTKVVRKDQSGKKIAFWSNKDGQTGLNGQKPGLYQLAEVESAISNGQTIFLPEGEPDCDTLRVFGLVATTNAGGGGEKWRIEDTPLVNAREIGLLYDRDPVGEGRRDTIAGQLKDLGIPYRIIELPGAKDVSDWILEHSFEEFVEVWEDAPVISPFGAIVSAAEISDMDLDAPKYWVAGLLTEGLTLFAGKPKTGKSVLALQVALAAGVGGVVAGKWQARKTEVLYLALEDNNRRMKTRIVDLCGEMKVPNTVKVAYEWPRIRDGGIERLEAYMRREKNTGIVIIDVLQNIRPMSDKKDNAYQADYEGVKALQAFAGAHGIAVLLVHHQRKMAGDGSIFDTVSGTLGLNAAADTVMVLESVKTAQGWINTLHARGRDMEEDIEVAMELKRPLGWQFMGDAEEFKTSKERQEILEFVRTKGKAGATRKEIADHLIKNMSTTRHLLDKMCAEGQLESVVGSKDGIRYRIPVVF